MKTWSDKVIKRKKTNVIKVGSARIGGNNPVVVQSMLKNRLGNTSLIRQETQDLENAGCEIIRVAVPDRKALLLLSRYIKEKIFNVPIVADIQFDSGLAVEALEKGMDCARINPGNMGGTEKLEKIAVKAKEKKAAVRIGINSGSLDKKILRANSGNILESMVSSVLEVVRLFEKLEFYNFKISAKASSVTDTVAAYKTISLKTSYPLHLGVTEAGPRFTGVIKSSVGLGILLAEGIGDTVRVSLTDTSISEVKAAYTILSSLNIRHRGVDIISCPTCGRTRVNLKEIVTYVENLAKSINKDIKIAVMGCIVNGPGEAKDADIGIAYGIKKAAIFANGRVIKRIEISNVLEEFEKELKKML